ncbi:MAG: thaumatin family protein [Myxococcota bacterium]
MTRTLNSKRWLWALALCALGCGEGGANLGTEGEGEFESPATSHTVTLVNHCDQPVWVASNAISPEASSDWALAPRCMTNAQCADGQRCDDSQCTCTSDDDCRFGATDGTSHAACRDGMCVSIATIAVEGGWSGRFWGRTGCTGSDTRFVCETGQCGPAAGGNFDCATTSSTANRATLFELFAAGAGGIDNFDVSLVSGYNVPIVVTAELPADHAAWQPDTAYQAGAGIIEAVGDHTFGFTAAGASGTSGDTKPDFPGVWRASVMDGPQLEWINVGPQCERSGCQSDLLSTCPAALQVMSGDRVVACDAPANACTDTMATCNDDLDYYQCQNNGGANDLFGNVLDLQSPNAETYVCFSADDCPAGTECSLNPTFVSGFALPSGTGLCLPVTQNGGCTPTDDGKSCPLRTFPFVEYQCQTLAGGIADAQVCVPPITDGLGELWWNAANWEPAAGGPDTCTTDSQCASGDKCLDAPTLGGARQCSGEGGSCACYTPRRCSSDRGANDGCPGPRQCLNDIGVPDGTGGVNCTTEACYCGPQGIYSGACGPTNPAWNTASANVGNWATTFKNACPVAYAYQYDDPSSNWSCPNPADDVNDYRVAFCLAP